MHSFPSPSSSVRAVRTRAWEALNPLRTLIVLYTYSTRRCFPDTFLASLLIVEEWHKWDIRRRESEGRETSSSFHAHATNAGCFQPS